MEGVVGSNPTVGFFASLVQWKNAAFVMQRQEFDSPGGLDVLG
jgi:hypothetical protein